MKLKELKATDFQDDQKYDFFSIGATEQHGPFLPFGTDTYITDYLAEQVSKEFPELVILPTLEVSRSKEHRGFYGTLWLSEETLKSVIFDICNSIKERARNIFITSFHFNDPYIENFIENTRFDGVNMSIFKLQTMRMMNMWRQIFYMVNLTDMLETQRYQICLLLMKSW